MEKARFSHSDFLASRRFPGLDGIRAFSVLAVLWHHLSLDFSLVGDNEFLGVDMFFVLSGWLIVTLLLREKDRHGDISLKAFYARRTLRIFPLYYAVILLVCVYHYLTNSDDPLISGLPWYLTYLVNWVYVGGIMSVAWSLASEEQFYLVWPVLERFLTRHWLWVLLVVVIFINQLINFDLLATPFDTAGADGTKPLILQITFTPILLGVLAAHVMHESAGYAFLCRTLSLGSRWAAPIIAIAFMGFTNIAPDDISGWPRLCIHILMTLFLVSVVCTPTSTIMPILTNWPMRRIGAVSYGMYLMHLPIFAAVLVITGKYWPLNSWPNIALCVLGTWLVAELSFRLFETPIMKARRFFIR